jgi:hypothetical protein
LLCKIGVIVLELNLAAYFWFRKIDDPNLFFFAINQGIFSFFRRTWSLQGLDGERGAANAALIII